MFVIILISFVLQSLYLNFNPLRVPLADAEGYDRIGYNISLGKGFTLDGINPTSFYPLFPFFVGGIYWIFGRNYLILQIILAILVASSCGLVYKIGESVFNRKVGLYSGIVMAFHPAFIGLSRIMYAEPLFIVLILSMLYFFVLGISSQKKLNIFVSGVCLGLATLVKPFAILFPLAATVAIFLLLRLKKGFVFAIFFNLAVISAVLPWTVRNYFIFGDIRPVSGLAIKKDGKIEKVDYFIRYNKKFSQESLNTQQEFLIDDYYKKAGITPLPSSGNNPDYSGTPKNFFDLLRRIYITSYCDIIPIGMPLSLFIKDKRVAAHYWHFLATKAITIFLSLVIFVFGVMGMIISLRQWRKTIILILFFVYLSVFFYLWVVYFGQVGICGRYGISAVGILIVFAVNQILSLKQYLTRIRKA